MDESDTGDPTSTAEALEAAARQGDAALGLAEAILDGLVDKGVLTEPAAQVIRSDGELRAEEHAIERGSAAPRRRDRP